MRMREIAETRVRYGFWRIFILLRREGWTDNHKRVYRIYKEEGLNLRTKRPRRRKAAAHRMERPVVSSIDEVWSMDFVSDELFNGRRIKALTIVDNFSRECIQIHVGRSIMGLDVVGVLEGLKAAGRGTPKRIQVDNGSEFISKVLDLWAYENDVTLDLSRPGKPTDNPYIESFNGSFRDECLNINYFMSLEDAQEIIEEWKWEEAMNKQLPTPQIFRRSHPKRGGTTSQIRPRISTSQRYNKQGVGQGGGQHTHD